MNKILWGHYYPHEDCVRIQYNDGCLLCIDLVGLRNGLHGKTDDFIEELGIMVEENRGGVL